jgi:hypothetical protein
MKVPTLLFLAAASVAAFGQKPASERREFLPPPFDRYIERRVAELSSATWLDEITPGNWPEKQAAMRRQLQSMLGLDPWPARGDLQPAITGTVQGDGYIVEKLHFQSLPGLYVTANLYRPTGLKEPAPAILYVCGHAECGRERRESRATRRVTSITASGSRGMATSASCSTRFSSARFAANITALTS